jgi:hypothetical protein
MSSDVPVADRASRATPWFASWGAGLALIVALAALYLFPAARLGLWEPWETSIATLARYVATTDGISPFAPLRGDALVQRSWLETWLLSRGYQLGSGSELGFRLPLVMLVTSAALLGFVVLRQFFGTVRALCASLLFASLPFILLSATNLAGGAIYEAPLTLTLLVVAALVGEWERVRLPATIALGPLLALCFWGGGIIGLGMPLAVIGLFGVGSREERFSEDRAILPMLLGGLIAFAGVVLPLALVLTSGWEAYKNLFGAGITLALPAALVLLTAAGSRVRFLFHPIGTPVALVLFLAMLAPGLMSVAGATADFDGLLGALLYQEFLTGRVLPTHVTYDVLIRIVGASTFPTIILVPFGFAYLIRSYDGPSAETDDGLDGPRAVKQFLSVWMAVGFLIYGIASSLAGDYKFPVSFPMAAAVGLALGDARFRQALTGRRAVMYLAGFTALLLLAMTSKDVRGMANEDLGQPGPHVVFERLLTDGSVAFPATYAFENIKLFMLAWMLLVVFTFAEPLRNVGRFGVVLRDWALAPRDTRGRLRRIVGRVTAPVLRATAWKGALLVNTAGRLERAWTRITRGRHPAVLALAGFTAVSLAWAAQLSYRDVPRVTNHLSQKGIVDTFERLAGPDATLHVAGVGDDDNSYYLGEGKVERLDRVSAIRDLLCNAEGRVFVVLPFASLAEAHFSAREERNRSGEHPCGAPQDFYVVDGRSSRYVLASNQLDTQAGEEDQSVIARNVFTRETLPETARLVESPVTVDDRLELVAVELPEEPIGRGPFTVSAYWEVKERPTSNHEIFIHVDNQGNRINGDHDPVGGHYPMRYWVPGEIVRDSHTMEVGRADRAGEYTVYYGFFRGDNRLSVTGGASDNRIRLGTINVR